MKKQALTILGILACSCCGFAQGITVYADAGFTGSSKVISADIPWIGNDWNDLISSIRIPGGYRIQVFEDANYSGPSKIIESDWTVTTSDLTWNDKISSIKIIATNQKPRVINNQSGNQGYADRPNQGRSTQNILAYEHGNFDGASMVISGNMPWIGNDWNDRISSIRIPAGYRLQVFEDANYSGASKILESNWTVTNAALEWNDRISSVKIIPSR